MTIDKDRSEGSGCDMIVLSTGDVSVVMGAEHAAELGDRVQTALLEALPLTAVLTVLTEAGVGEAPEFAYMASEGRRAVRVVLRGGLQADVRHTNGRSRVCSARALSTWTESVLEGCADVTIRSNPNGPSLVRLVLGLPPSAPEVGAAAAGADGAEGEGPEAEPAPVDAEPEIEATPCAAEAHVADVVAEAPPTDGDEGSTEPGGATEPEEGPSRSALATVAPPAPDDDVDLAHLFETRHRGVEAAAVRDGDDLTTEAPAPIPPLPAASVDLRALPPPSGVPIDLSAPGPAPSQDVLGDHDGLTIGPGVLAALRDGITVDPLARPTTAVQGLGPTVRAVTCPSGHLNPPHADRCRACQAGITDQAPMVVARPSLGYLSFDTGLVADIDRPLVIGRKPTAPGLAAGGEPPGLVVLADPDGSLSRTHAEVRVEGWEVLIVDRNSTNGTLVELPGEDPVLLRPDEPFIISPGTVLRFADSVSCRYEAGPR